MYGVCVTGAEVALGADGAGPARLRGHHAPGGDQQRRQPGLLQPHQLGHIGRGERRLRDAARGKQVGCVENRLSESALSWARPTDRLRVYL